MKIRFIAVGLGLTLLGASVVSQCAFAAPESATRVKQNAKQAMRTTVFTVGKMHCEGCANGLNSSLNKMEGVKTARVDFKTKRATINFDARKITQAKLLAFFKTAGFPARVVS